MLIRGKRRAARARRGADPVMPAKLDTLTDAWEAARALRAFLDRYGDLPEVVQRRAAEMERLLDAMTDAHPERSRIEDAARALAGGEEGRREDATSEPGQSKADAIRLACASWRGTTYRLHVTTPERGVFLSLTGARHLQRRVESTVRYLAKHRPGPPRSTRAFHVQPKNLAHRRRG